LLYNVRVKGYQGPAYNANHSATLGGVSVASMCHAETIVALAKFLKSGSVQPCSREELEAVLRTALEKKYITANAFIAENDKFASLVGLELDTQYAVTKRKWPTQANPMVAFVYMQKDIDSSGRPLRQIDTGTGHFVLVDHVDEVEGYLLPHVIYDSMYSGVDRKLSVLHRDPARPNALAWERALRAYTLR